MLLSANVLMLVPWNAPLLSLAYAVEALAAALTLGGMVYGLLALWGAQGFERWGRKVERLAVGEVEFTPGVSLLKPVRGVDPQMYAAFASHCRQQYAGEIELLFGVRSLSDPAVAQVARLRVEHPDLLIRLVECPLALGANGKVSSLAQMVPQARYEHLVVNDADIRVSPHYLSRVLAPFASPATGLVTVPYRGAVSRHPRGRTLWSRLEALGIATDFFPGVFAAIGLERGIRFGLGSTLATTKTALAAIGGFAALADELADDYQLGARLTAAGYRVELVAEVVETGVPAYTLRGFADHQLRWARGVRDARPRGYLGLGVTHMVPWALAVVVASGATLESLSLLSVAVLVRVAVALTVGVGVLGDAQVLADLWLLPLRDCFGLFFWAWSYAGDEVVWRGERFHLQRGVLKESGKRSKERLP